MFPLDPYTTPAPMPAAGALSIVIVIAAGVLLLWWKLHRIGIDPRQLIFTRRDDEAKLTIEGLDIALWTAPQLKEGDYRDDTGKSEAIWTTPRS